MAALAGKFRSEKQDWATPAEVFAPLAREFCFTLDAAANSTNAKAESFFTRNREWARSRLEEEYCLAKSSICLLQAGRLADWVRKSARAAAAGATVVMLIPARTNTVWFHDYCLALAEIRFIRGRPKFDSAKHGLPQPLCIAIFRPAS